MKASELLGWAERTIAASEAIDHWEKRGDRHDAQTLLREVLGIDVHQGAEASARDSARYRRMVERRARGEPIPHITGFTEFMGLRLSVRPEVFVPRSSTEWLAEQAIRRLRLRRAPIALDVGTGAGAVACALADRVPGATVLGTDVSEAAIRLARLNARHLGLSVRFVAGDLLAAVPKRWKGNIDVMAAHLPYIGRGELRWVPGEVVDFEPRTALTDGTKEGLELLGRLSDEARAWLVPRGWLLAEVASDRSRAVVAAFRRMGYTDVRSTRGDMPWTRVVVARRGSPVRVLDPDVTGDTAPR